MRPRCQGSILVIYIEELIEERYNPKFSLSVKHRKWVFTGTMSSWGLFAPHIPRLYSIWELPTKVTRGISNTFSSLGFGRVKDSQLIKQFFFVMRINDYFFMLSFRLLLSYQVLTVYSAALGACWSSWGLITAYSTQSSTSMRLFSDSFRLMKIRIICTTNIKGLETQHWGTECRLVPCKKSRSHQQI